MDLPCGPIRANTELHETGPRLRRSTMRKHQIDLASTVTPVLVAELLAEGERMPVYVHVIDHPDGARAGRHGH